MSLTITQDNSIAGPIGIYSQRLMQITDDVSTNYVDVDLTYLSKTKSLRLTQHLTADGSYNAYIDLNKLMEDSFESICTDPSLLFFNYSVSVDAWYNGTHSTSTSLDTQTWVLNGIKDNYDHYLMNSTNKSYLDGFNGAPKFLNDQVTNYIHWDTSIHDQIGAPAINELNLYSLNGVFRGNTNSGTYSYISNLEIIKFENDVSTLHYLTDLYNTATKIQMVQIDPNYLNTNIVDISINENTTKYTVRDASCNSELITVNLQNVNLLNDKYFRLGWINGNGVLNHFNFTHNYTKKINISKNNFRFLSTEFQEYTKQFNTKALEIYNITTGWIKEEDSKVLEKLWVSPSVKASAFYPKAKDYYSDFIDNNLIWEENIILNVSNMEVKKKLYRKLINYSIDFIISKEYRIQKY